MPRTLTGTSDDPAGAIDRFAPDLGPAFSGHNAYWSWGPPPEDADTVIAVGLDEDRLAGWFDEVETVSRIDNGLDLDNEEQGVPSTVATGRRVPWSEIWPELRRVG